MLAYYLDPRSGERRREELRERVGSVLTERAEEFEDVARYTSATAYLMSEKARSTQTTSRPTANDATLAHKVESEVFRDATIPKGKININAENGVVVVRGVIEHPDQKALVEDAVRHVAGVHHVQSLLHLP